MQSEYNLVKQTKGIGYFARITLEVELTSSGIEVLAQLNEPPNEHQGEAAQKRAPWIDPAWIEGAVRGARACAEALLCQGKICGCRIAVVCVIGTDVDTSPSTAFCAAALAAWQALNPDAALPTLKFRDGQCSVQFD